MKKTLLSVLAMGFLASTAMAQVPRMVMLEEFTNASCGPCASQNPAYNQLIMANPTKVVSLKYQTAFPGFDPMNQQNPTEVANRRGLYGISGVPTCAMNGRIPDNSNTPGGGWTGYAGGPYGFNQTVIDNEYASTTPLAIGITHSISTNLDSASVRIAVRNVTGTDFNAPTANQLKLMVAMTEQEITFNSAPGSNGETEFTEIMRKMYPNDGGTTMPNVIAAGDSAVYEFDVEIPSYIYSLTEIAFVAFVQDMGTNEVHQAGLSGPVPVNGPDAGIADNTTAPADYCAATVTPEFTLSNDGTQDITSADVTVELNGTPVSQSWSGTLTPGQSTTVTFSPVSLADGVNEWFATVSNINGGGDVNGSNNTTPTVSAIRLPATPGTAPYAQTFEGTPLGGIPSNAYAENPSGARMFVVDQGISSTVTYPLGGFGQSESCLRWDYYAISAGVESSLLIENVDLSSFGGAQLTFSHAYAQYSTENDRLQVFASSDCGVTWTNIWDKAGAALATAPVEGSARFYPEATEWAADTADLSAFVGGNVTIKFTGISDFGNSLYFDDVNVTGASASVEEVPSLNAIKLFPNPAGDNATVELDLANNTEVSVIVYDMVGKIVAQIAPTALNAGVQQIALNTSNFTNGMYYVSIQAGENVTTEKLVIKK